jgi:enterochelin esterase family protein
MRELFMDEPFVEFLADELLPWARGRLSFADDPELTLLAGSSAGGLTAAFAALRRPERFGLVVSQSGGYQRGPLPHEYAVRDRLPIRFYLDAGILETVPWQEFGALVHANRHLRNDSFAIAWPGYSGSGSLTDGNLRVGSSRSGDD